MYGMKSYVLGLLMLIMLTPSLACAMTVCPMQAAQSGTNMSCHDVQDSVKAPMLVMDCLGVDLFQQDVNNDFQPDQSIEKIDYVWADLFNNAGFEPNSMHDIRGPPEWLDIPRLKPSIILTTQRLRI